MIKVDLHVHSRASKRPVEWFLKKVGARESYTKIDTLYAQARGVAALVTDVGGPQEIIKEGETGYVLNVSDPAPWVEKIEYIHTVKTELPQEYHMLRTRCIKRMKAKFNWDDALFNIMEGRNTEDPASKAMHIDNEGVTIKDQVMENPLFPLEDRVSA